MPSKALGYWEKESASELDELENAHVKVGGKGPGRKYLTRQINHAYLVAKAARFQRFCRDLHSEAAQRLSDAVEPRVSAARPCGSLLTTASSTPETRTPVRWGRISTAWVSAS